MSRSKPGTAVGSVRSPIAAQGITCARRRRASRGVTAFRSDPIRRLHPNVRALGRYFLAKITYSLPPSGGWTSCFPALSVAPARAGTS